MKSNYKQLGPYIREIVEKNSQNQIEKLRGVSIQKCFIPSIANTIGTDMTTYKIVRVNQFAYGPVTSRNGDKISVALLQESDCIISTSYTVFEIIDHNELLPEYLMMWFRRPEFDRYSRFMSHGSVREIFGWEEMCNVELPIPSPDKQKEIVVEYNTIVNRIKLNEQLNQKLEETAQAIYKQWFVDFEFPDENGKPYKSSGGEMVWNEMLEKEIPLGWGIIPLGKVLAKKGYIRGPFGSALLKDDMQPDGVPVYEQQHAIYDHRDFRYYIAQSKYEKLIRFSVQPNDLVISCSGTLGRVTQIRRNDPIGIINQALLILRPDETKIGSAVLKQFLISPIGQNEIVTNSGGSAQVNIAKRELVQEIPLILPLNRLMKNAEVLFKVIDDKIVACRKELVALHNLRDILLSRLTMAA